MHKFISLYQLFLNLTRINSPCLSHIEVYLSSLHLEFLPEALNRPPFQYICNLFRVYRATLVHRQHILGTILVEGI